MTRKEILERLKGTTGYVTINGRVYKETPATRAERAELMAEELGQENAVLKEDNALKDEYLIDLDFRLSLMELGVEI